MKIVMFTAGAALALAVSPAVAVAAETATGMIVAVDRSSAWQAHGIAIGSVQLDDGKIFLLPADANLDALTRGMEVAITYDSQNGQLMASNIEAVPSKVTISEPLMYDQGAGSGTHSPSNQASVGNAQKAGSVAEGSIKAIYAENHTLMLSDGTLFTVPDTLSTAELAVGDRLQVHYNAEGADKVVSTISVVAL